MEKNDKSKPKNVFVRKRLEWKPTGNNLQDNNRQLKKKKKLPQIISALPVLQTHIHHECTLAFLIIYSHSPLLHCLPSPQNKGTCLGKKSTSYSMRRLFFSSVDVRVLKDELIVSDCTNTKWWSYCEQGTCSLLKSFCYSLCIWF